MRSACVKISFYGNGFYSGSFAAMFFFRKVSLQHLRHLGVRIGVRGMFFVRTYIRHHLLTHEDKQEAAHVSLIYANKIRHGLFTSHRDK